MKDIRIPSSFNKLKRATLTVDLDTAAIIRRIALAEGRGKDVTAVLNDMVQAYVAAKHPDWSIEDA